MELVQVKRNSSIFISPMNDASSIHETEEYSNDTSKTSNTTKTLNDHSLQSTETKSVPTKKKYNKHSCVSSDEEESDQEFDNLNEEHIAEDDARLETKFLNFKGQLMSLLKTVACLALVLIPGILCDQNIFNNTCIIYSTPFFQYSILFSVIIIAVFISQLAVLILVFFIRKSPLLGRHFEYYIRNIKEPLKYSISSLLVQLCFPLMNVYFKPHYSNSIDDAAGASTVIGQLISAVTITSIAFLLKAILLRLFAVRFHKGAYYARIKSSLLAELVIRLLLQTDKEEDGMILNFFGKSKKLDEESPSPRISNLYSKFAPSSVLSNFPISELELLDKRSISNHRFAVLVEHIKVNDMNYTESPFSMVLAETSPKVKHLDTSPQLKASGSFISLELSSKIKPIGSSFLNTVSSRMGSEWKKYREEHLHEQMSQSQACKILSNYIFSCYSTSEHIHKIDFQKIMSKELSEAGFKLFDRNQDGALSRKEIASFLLEVSRERKALKTALYDCESAIEKLENAVTGFLCFILFIIYFVIFGVNPTTILVTLSSFLLAIAFAIGTTAQSLLKSILFLFVTHPFDIGDRVVIKDVVYTVTKVNLLTCEFKRYDNAIFYFVNSQLADLPILNLRRSGDMIDIISIQISYYTPSQTLRELENQIANFLLKQSAHFHSKFEVEYRELENSNRLNVNFWIQHRNNFANRRKFRERRGRVLLKIKRVCEELDVEYHLPTQRVYHENVEDAKLIGGYSGDDSSKEFADPSPFLRKRQ